MLAILFSTIVFGIAPFLYKRILKEISIALALLMISVGFSTCCLVYWLFTDDKNIDLHNMTPTCWMCIIAAACGVLFIGYLVYLKALSVKDKNTAVITAIIQSSIVVTLLISYFIFKEKLDKYQFLGIMLIFSGCMLISSTKMAKDSL